MSYSKAATAANAASSKNTNFSGSNKSGVVPPDLYPAFPCDDLRDAAIFYFTADVGDYTQNGPLAETMEALARKTRSPDALIFAGDLFYSNAASTKEGSKLDFHSWRARFVWGALANVPQKICMGNHCYPGLQFYLDYVNSPDNVGGVWQMRGDDPSEKPSTQYTFTAPVFSKSSHLDHDIFAAVDKKKSQQQQRPKQRQKRGETAEREGETKQTDEANDEDDETNCVEPISNDDDADDQTECDQHEREEENEEQQEKEKAAEAIDDQTAKKAVSSVAAADSSSSSSSPATLATTTATTTSSFHPKKKNRTLSRRKNSLHSRRHEPRLGLRRPASSGTRARMAKQLRMAVQHSCPTAEAKRTLPRRRRPPPDILRGSRTLSARAAAPHEAQQIDQLPQRAKKRVGIRKRFGEERSRCVPCGT